MYEKLQEYLLRDGMCLLNLHSAVSIIIHHNKIISQWLILAHAICLVWPLILARLWLFLTRLNDLMVHIKNLRNSLDANWYAVSSISVKTDQKIMLVVQSFQAVMLTKVLMSLAIQALKLQLHLTIALLSDLKTA